MTTAPDLHDLRRATRWSVASVVWTVGASGAAIVAGLATGSLLLVVFGAVGGLDMVGSLALVVHFRHAVRHEKPSDRTEQLALRAIALGMATIATGTVVLGIRHLLHAGAVRSSATGTVLLVASAAALGVFAAGKHAVGGRVGSRALVADSHVSAMGAGFAVFALGGTMAAGTLGWRWVDPVGSLVIAFVGLATAAGHARHA